jgi:hypothetical protein
MSRQVINRDHETSLSFKPTIIRRRGLFKFRINLCTHEILFKHLIRLDGRGSAHATVLLDVNLLLFTYILYWFIHLTIAVTEEVICVLVPCLKMQSFDKNISNYNLNITFHVVSYMCSLWRCIPMDEHRLMCYK